MKILLFDIESSPNIAYIWNKYEQDALGDFIKERQIISFAWKWLGEKEVHVLALPMFKSYKRDRNDNRELVLALHKTISEADVLVGHNVCCFDDKMANAEFIRHGLKPPPPHRFVDTLKVARQRFRFNSNKLGDLGKHLKLGIKTPTGGFDLWVGCLRGDKDCWELMMEYNRQDVVLLEKIYLKMRPWMTNHPDMNAKDQHVGCPQCRGVKLIRQGWRVGIHGKTPRFQCKDCGSWAKGTMIKKEMAYR